MTLREIDRYLRALARVFHEPCQIFLTGAAAGAAYGRIRATLDLDFALKFKARSPQKKERLWQDFTHSCEEVTGRTGIAVQYAEDIDRWSSITFLDYENHTRPYKRFGGIEVRLLRPAYWAIGKLTRYLDPDIRDLIQVLKKTKTPWRELAGVLGRALRRSPKSTACYLFRRQVEDFLTSYGREIWGKSYSAKKAVRAFRLKAGIRD